MIKKEVFGQIILDFRKMKLPKLIKRDLEVDLEIPLKRAVVVLGPRRSGKTYYLYSLMQKLINKGVEKERILYINFEDPKLVGIEFSDLNLLLEVFYEIYPQTQREKVWFFLDEVQNVDNWEIFVRGVLDRRNIQVFLSGSSAKLLSREVATAMRGRSLSYLILPFSFKEFLKARKVSFAKYLSSHEKTRVMSSFWDYFSAGGYPEVVIYPSEKEKIIREIIEVTIYQDLIERHKIRHSKIVKLMFNALVEAKEFSVHKFFNFLKSQGIMVSKNSLYNYLEFFNEAFIFFPLRRFSKSIKNLEQSLPKMYCIDNALIEAIVGDNKGKKLENLVFLSLLQKGFEPNRDIFYYSQGVGEVDFFVRRKRYSALIQACYDIHYQSKDREIKPLLKASKDVKCNNLMIITSDYEREEKIGSKKIKYIPLWRWLLS